MNRSVHGTELSEADLLVVERTYGAKANNFLWVEVNTFTFSESGVCVDANYDDGMLKLFEVEENVLGLDKDDEMLFGRMGATSYIV